MSSQPPSNPPGSDPPPPRRGGTESDRPAARDAGRELRREAKARVGRTIKGKWTLDALLGVGGMASVYAATHRNGSRAALKILHVDFAADDSIRSRFVREGYVANRVDHPGRVAVLDDDVTEQGSPFLVMELLEGETLRQRVKREGRLAPLYALHIAAEILDTLDPFHKQRVVHRDLKPGNIFLTDEGEVKLLDFGIAQLREAGQETTLAGTALGTPWFMSPEQAVARNEALDGRADIFAVGAMLYAVLSGQRLWQGHNENQAFVLAATQPAPSLARVAPDLPVEVIAAVDKALQWDARNRFQTAAEMRDALQGIRAKLEATGAAPPPTSTAQPTIPPAAPVPAIHPARRQFATGQPAGAIPPGDQGSVPPASMPPLSGRAGVSLPPLPPLRSRAESSIVPGDAEGSKLDEVFRRMDRLLKAIRHYGIAHPEASAKIHGLHEAIISLLRIEPEGLAWEVQPYCFTVAGEPVWEPEPPADVIPYNLFVSGLKGVQVQPGVTEEELQSFCYIITLDPTQDPGSGGVDIAGALWEAGLANIICDISDDLGAFDAAEEESFWAEADDVEALVRDDLKGGEQADVEKDVVRAAAAAMVLDPMEMLAREDVAEAAAMSLNADGGKPAYSPAADALKLDKSAAIAMKADLGLPADRWRDRFLDWTLDALADAAWREDEAAVWEAFGAYARRLARQGDLAELLTTYDALRDRLLSVRQEPVFARSLPGVTAQMWSGGVFDLLVRTAAGTNVEPGAVDDGGEAGPSLADRVGKMLPVVLDLLDDGACADALTIARELPEGEALEHVLSYLERHVAGRESYFSDQLERVEPALAPRLLRMLAQTGTRAGREAVRSLLRSANPVLRCEAMALLADSHDTLKDQLLTMVEALDESVRKAALSTMMRHQVRAAGPGLVRAIEDESFWSRSPDFQRELLETLHALHPRRGEEIATAIVSKHGLMKDDDLERTRTIAAELLGDWGETDQALEGLQEAMTRRWWNSQALRSAAAKAAHAVSARIAERKGGSEEAST